MPLKTTNRDTEMAQELVRYEAACRAIAECKSVDEVKSWTDKAAAMQAYGRMAQDKTLEVDAAEIRIRAERRLGEMLAHQKATGGLATGARLAGSKPGSNDGSSAVVANDHRPKAPKLADAGISKDLSSRAQKLAAVPAGEFEAEIGQWRERVSEEGNRVSARLQTAGERELKKNKRTLDQSQEPGPTFSDGLAESANLIEDLTAENESLRDRLAVESMDASEDEKTQAARTIAELRTAVKNLTEELSAVKASRDTYMRESAAAKKEAIYWRKQAEKSVRAAA